EWDEKFKAYKTSYPELAAEFERRIQGKLPANWDETTAAFINGTAKKAENIASRKASQNALETYGPVLPELIGGSADLTGSNLTMWSNSKVINGNSGGGNYIYYGVREFAMSAINNGISLQGGLIPYGGTFLMFSDYARNALRMAALMKIRNIFVFTHDSIGLGEDGPTHQAVEQAATLRLMPNMSVWRPCDTVETAVAWKAAIENKTGPTSLLLSRQTLKHIPRSEDQIKAISRGGYVLIEGSDTPDVIIIATGSEVELAKNVTQQLNNKDYKVRLISMPCAEVFNAQDVTYRDKVLPPQCRKRIAVEAGVSDYWCKYVGIDGKVLGIDSFGESAPAPTVYEHFGLTETNLKEMVDSLL
ncbi:MAG: transketolase C-terminal domain-containing protein, partial [Gammaproteobacteria bacterium]